VENHTLLFHKSKTKREYVQVKIYRFIKLVQNTNSSQRPWINWLVQSCERHAPCSSSFFDALLRYRKAFNHTSKSHATVTLDKKSEVVLYSKKTSSRLLYQVGRSRIVVVYTSCPSMRFQSLFATSNLDSCCGSMLNGRKASCDGTACFMVAREKDSVGYKSVREKGKLQRVMKTE
jgi:hypothetical protein